MSSDRNTLNPSLAIPMRPIPVLSADQYLGIESEHGEESGPSSGNEYLDLESGNGPSPSVGNDEVRSTNEDPHLPSRHHNLEGRPKLLQRSKTP